MFRFVVRPKHIWSTPKVLANALGAQTRHTKARNTFNKQTDIFMGYPPIDKVILFEDAEERNQFHKTWCFYTADKRMQREYLSDIFPIPTLYDAQALPLLPPDQKLVIRPLRHMGGQDFQVVTAGTAFEYDPRTHYISELYKRTKEFRIIIVRGFPIITLLKKPIRPTSQEEPWNHSNNFMFQTINRPINNNLLHTDIYTRINNNPSFFKTKDIVGLDVLYNESNQYKPYVVTELNFCPALKIQENLQRITSYLREMQ